MFIEGTWYQIINVLFYLMSISGPTPAVGLNGSTSAFLTQTHQARLR